MYVPEGGGSSPLTRGKPDLTMEDATALGLIPTHAGKTCVSGGRIVNGGAHPHSRGENMARKPPRSRGRGSSPLTRGKQIGCLRSHGQGRLIPTHAGKTCSCIAGELVAGAHPHSRGENSTRSELTRPSRGSSPLTRGKRAYRRNRPRLAGLIPTHAGKTATATATHSRSTAHPHSRGEN